MISIDAINSARPGAVASLAFAVADAVGKIKDRKECTDEEAVVGVAAALSCIVAGAKLSPQKVLEVADRLQADADRKYTPEFRAFRRFIRNDFFRSTK